LISDVLVAYGKERLVVWNKKDTSGRARVTAEEERILYED